MSPQENIQLMRRWFQEVWNDGRTQTVYDLLSPEVVATGQAGPQVVLHGALPNLLPSSSEHVGLSQTSTLRWKIR